MACVLLAEPDRDARALLASALVEAGHEVHAAGDAFAALTAGLQAAPDLVLLSTALPKGRPQEVLRRLAIAGIVPRRIVGLARHGDTGMDLPDADAWLLWPIDPQELTDSVG